MFYSFGRRKAHTLGFTDRVLSCEYVLPFGEETMKNAVKKPTRLYSTLFKPATNHQRREFTIEMAYNASRRDKTTTWRDADVIDN